MLKLADPEHSQMTMIDLFAGAGGLSEGLHNAGFTSLYASEIVPTYAQTYAANHRHAIVERNDIRSVDAHQVRLKLGLEKRELALIAGGPPCQGFSINAPKRSSSDHRNHLFKEYLRFVEEFEPRSVIIENVPGLVSFDKGSTLAAILSSLTALGYAADVRILYAPLFGIPQTRWRTIIIGLRNDEDQPVSSLFPIPTHYAPMRINFTSQFMGRPIVIEPGLECLSPFITTRDAISDLPPLMNGEAGSPLKEYRTVPQNDYQARLRSEGTLVQNHESARLGHINLERLAHIPPGGNWTNIPHELLPAGMKRARRSDHTKRYGRVHPDGLASTILTKCDPHWGAYFHYDQDRSFTVREAARLQSFPDSYVFTGSRVEQYEQVGNAVPPILAEAVGKTVRNALLSSYSQLAKAV